MMKILFLKFIFNQKIILYIYKVLNELKNKQKKEKTNTIIPIFIEELEKDIDNSFL